MALKIIHNHNLLPEDVYHPKYPLTHFYGFTYNSHLWSLNHILSTRELVLSSGDITIVLDSNISSNSAYTTNAIEYSDNIIWVGYSDEFASSCSSTSLDTEKFYFCIVDLQSQTSRKYVSELNPRFIKPVGRDYWTYSIDKELDEESSVPTYVFTWESLTRLGDPISPVVVGKPGTQYYPIAWCQRYRASFVAVNGTTLEFLDAELKTMFSTNIFSFFPDYKKLTHPDSSVLYEPDYLITINDNCLLYYEWYNVIDQKWGDIEGCESKYCLDLTTGQSIPFSNKPLDYFVTDLFPFRDFDGIIKLHSSEFYPAGSWKTIYEPKQIHELPVDSALGKRKALCQIITDA